MTLFTAVITLSFSFLVAANQVEESYLNTETKNEN